MANRLRTILIVSILYMIFIFCIFLPVFFPSLNGVQIIFYLLSLFMWGAIMNNMNRDRKARGIDVWILLIGFFLQGVGGIIYYIMIKTGSIKGSTVDSN